MSLYFAAAGAKEEVLAQLNGGQPGTTVGDLLWQALVQALQEDTTTAPVGQTLHYMVQVSLHEANGGGPATMSVSLQASFVTD